MVIPKAKIAAGLANRADKPGAANEWLKAMKAMYSWAVDREIVIENPAAGIKRVKYKTVGFHIWSLDELRAFTDRHPAGTMAYLALSIMLHFGLRREDAMRFGRQNIRDGVVRYVTGKTGATLVTRAASLFSAIVEKTEPKHGHMTFLINGHGRPFASAAAFGNWFHDRCVEAGIPHCTPHGVRKSAASIARTEGASDGQLDAMFTWADPDQRSVYTAGADMMRLASEGFALLEDALLREGVLKPVDGRKVNNLGSLPDGVIARFPNQTSK
jgi:integrase